MPAECEAALLEIQYFVSRDWKLDPQLHAACLSDATRLCNAKKNWVEIVDSSGNSGNAISSGAAQVLPCLFRYVYHPTAELRVGGERAVSVACLSIIVCRVLLRLDFFV